MRRVWIASMAPGGLGAAPWLNGFARFGLGFHADLFAMHERAHACDCAQPHGAGAGLPAAEPAYTAGANRVPPMETP